MNDKEVQTHIEQLVGEEERLWALGDDRALKSEERKRLDEINVQLDRYYDLLRQRRALRETGGNPEAAQMRPANVVENYVE